MKVNLLGYERNALTDFMAELGEPSYRTDQILKWIHQRNVTDFSEMTDLSKQLRGRLGEIASVEGLRAVGDTVSTDGTRKWLLQLDDGNCVETVFIPEDSRGTLCISSQVGCSLTCSFCATGRQGFNRNLTTAEIIAQVRFAINMLSTDRISRPITNIVLMGMGEPLLNYGQVVPALRLMLDDCSYGFSRRKVTLSTAGVIPGIKRLLTDCPVSLAVSLHAPDDELRNQLVPINRKYPIADLMAACADYARYDRRWRVTFEYIMIRDVNDSIRHARNLVRLLADVPSKVNLIPYNSVTGLDYERSSTQSIDRFRDVLLAADVMTITRKTRGDEVAAACGQLVGRFKDRTKRSSRLGTALADVALAE
ncbi:MAG: 23S rRNA (adenine(2503)-C(2))-methyltransferase RlmN [Acidiferrobacterales bacterium]|nr:23S rRNA (adenine(2503)-C(2))-methyltransferase RlmN [Acidiferrobacterales bacterium]